MKKIINILLLVIFAFSLVGCGEDTSTSTTSVSNIKPGQNITLSESTIVLTSQDAISELDNYSSNNNQSGQQDMISNGEAVVLPAGTQINVVKLVGMALDEAEIDVSGAKYYTHSGLLK